MSFGVLEQARTGSFFLIEKLYRGAPLFKNCC